LLYDKTIEKKGKPFSLSDSASSGAKSVVEVLTDLSEKERNEVNE
jgi:hypothetical protein